MKTPNRRFNFFFDFSGNYDTRMFSVKNVHTDTKYIFRLKNFIRPGGTYFNNPYPAKRMIWVSMRYDDCWNYLGMIDVGVDDDNFPPDPEFKLTKKSVTDDMDDERVVAFKYVMDAIVGRKNFPSNVKIREVLHAPVKKPADDPHYNVDPYDVPF